MGIIVLVCSRISYGYSKQSIRAAIISTVCCDCCQKMWKQTSSICCKETGAHIWSLRSYTAVTVLEISKTQHSSARITYQLKQRY